MTLCSGSPLSEKALSCMRDGETYMLAGHFLRGACALALVLNLVISAHAAEQTQVVLLGTGNPPADPDRSGPATAIVANDMVYLVEAREPCGAPKRLPSTGESARWNRSSCGWSL